MICFEDVVFVRWMALVRLRGLLKMSGGKGEYGVHKEVILSWVDIREQELHAIHCSPYLKC